MLRIAITVFALGMLASCASADGAKPSPRPTGCTADADCGAGRVCAEPCAKGAPRECVSGCRTSADCPGGQVCKKVSIQCLRCPCPTTACVRS